MRMNENKWLILSKITWGVLLAYFFIIGFVNWTMPHGPMIPTGLDVCEYDKFCREKYIEDTRGLDIPEWAKVVRRHGGFHALSLIFLGIFFSANSKKDKSHLE